jgi:ABC-type branched-subunit amino acid transport system ATPase component
VGSTCYYDRYMPPSGAADSLANAETELLTGSIDVAIAHALVSIAYSLLGDEEEETVAPLVEEKVTRRTAQGRKAARDSATPWQ